MLNCGATQDLFDLLEMEKYQNITVYVFDSHRPYHRTNVTNNQQILLMDDGLEDDVEEEEEINRNYSHGFTSAGLMYAFASQLNAVTSEILWWAILGLTDQHVHHRIDSFRYQSDYKHLKAEVLHRIPQPTDVAGGSQNGTPYSSAEVASGTSAVSLRLAAGFDTYQIVPKVDYKFFLYRHWTLYEAIAKSPYVISHLSYWRGKNRILELLAKVGTSIAIAKQSYDTLTLEDKTNFHSKIKNVANEFNLYELTEDTFLKPYPDDVSASDTVHALTALLVRGGEIIYHTGEEYMDMESENGRKNAPNEENTNNDNRNLKLRRNRLRDNFNSAYSALVQSLLLKQGLAHAKTLADCIVNTAIDTIQQNKVAVSVALRSCIINDAPLLTTPIPLATLAHLLVGMASKNGSKAFVIACRNEQKNSFLVVGLHPHPIKHRNLGRYFREAAVKTKSRITVQHFENSIIEIFAGDFERWIEFLRIFLKKL